MTLLLRAGRVLLGAAIVAVASPACYSAGGGTDPPANSFYFPVGLTVSVGGNVLYAINSDFDLQWNGGTIQSYDLAAIRRDTATLIQANMTGVDPGPIPFLFNYKWQPNCQYDPAIYRDNGSGQRTPLGQACAPPVDSTTYVRDSAIVGAFATDLQLAAYRPDLGYGGTRLFAPVRGNATVTWADVAFDDPTKAPQDASFAPFAIDCGVRTKGRCDGAHQAGNNPNATGDTRNVTLPGEPFGMAQSDDGTSLAVTHQTDTKTSLLTSGFGNSAVISGQPTMQFVLDGLPSGGNGIVAVPHDRYAVARCEDPDPVTHQIDTPPCVRQAFLQTSRAAAELDLLRYYDDDGSSLHRPFLQKEATFGLTVNAGGTDSRGIVIDPTPRLRCEAGVTDHDAAKLQACGRIPARVFFANRTPASMIVGEIGGPSPSGDGTYDPDRLVINGNVPLSSGPSKLYLAPVVDATGHYSLRVFIVCFDTNTIFVYDPDAEVIENVIYTGPGPFAMAFDPFSLVDVATHAAVPVDPRQPAQFALRRYRFAYLASFTQSYVQILDLDDSAASTVTFERIVYTLGQPTPPKGQ